MAVTVKSAKEIELMREAGRRSGRRWNVAYV